MPGYLRHLYSWITRHRTDAPTVTLDEIFSAELLSINSRRLSVGRPPAPLPARLTTRNNLIGLSVSGGGVRAATVCLGILQVLIKRNFFREIDYLSSVSGGGYFAGTITNIYAHATAQALEPAAAETPIHFLLERFATSPGHLESAEIQHLRNHASYLSPPGRRRPFAFPTLILIGFLMNIIILLPVLLFISVASWYWTRYVTTLRHHNLYIAGLVVFWVICYNVFLSNILIRRRQRYKYSMQERLLGWSSTLLVALIVVIFLNIQGDLINFITAHYAEITQRIYYGIVGSIGTIGVVISLLRNTVQRFQKFYTQFWRVMLGLSAPILLWLIVALIETTLNQIGAWESFERFLDWPLLGNTFGYAPYPRSLICFYGSIALALWAVGMIFININATSVHSFYRDRLHRAYLFAPAAALLKAGPSRFGQPLKRASSSMLLTTAPDVRLSQLSDLAPYHIINTAINIQSSKARNMKGRDADFIMFTKHFIGGESTGYCETAEMERKDPQINLGTAIAISGAALAPNQGIHTSRALRFLMALTNARLGYWMVNPRFIANHWGVRRKVTPYYFFRELLGNLHESRSHIYVSDGGHIENLGVYELLRRRCRYIVVCDAECDPTMAFPSLAHLIRIARIDFSIDVSLDLGKLRPVTNRNDPNYGRSGLHYAVGRINYGSEDGSGRAETGKILYLKSSITGDEVEYVNSYRARFGEFPHESTSDQFFTEAQFEAYRALGEHIADSACEGCRGSSLQALIEGLSSGNVGTSNAADPEKFIEPAGRAGAAA